MDPATGDPEADGYEDEYQLEEVELAAGGDYVIPSDWDLSSEWDHLQTGASITEMFTLSSMESIKGMWSVPQYIHSIFLYVRLFDDFNLYWKLTVSLPVMLSSVMGLVALLWYCWRRQHCAVQHDAKSAQPSYPVNTPFPHSQCETECCLPCTPLSSLSTRGKGTQMTLTQL